MADNEVKIKLVVEGNAKVELTAATKAVQEFGDTADKSAKKASGAFDVFKGVLAADAVKAGLGLIQDAATSLFDTFIVDGIAASRGYQDSLNQLSNSLKLSGDFSDAALQSFTELADEIEKNSKVSDDAVLQQAAYAKSLGLSNEQTEKLIRAAVELSAVTGKDLDSSVQELAKSMEGTAGKSLKLLEATKDLTKEQLKNGDAITAVLDRYGGSAASQLNTFSGGLTRIGNAFEDIQKEIGNAITTNQTVIAVFNAVAGILDDVTTSLEGNKSGFQRFVSDGVLLAIQSLSAFITVVDVVYRGVQALTSLIAGSLTGSLSVVAAGVGLFNDNAKQMSETLALAAKGSIEDFKSALVDDNALGVVQEALAKVETAAKASMGALRDGANEAAPAVDGAKNAVRSLTEEQVKLQEQAVKTHEELTKAALSEAEQLQAKVDQQTAAFEQGLISQAQYNADLAVLDEQFVANKQKVSDEILAQKITENDQLRQLDADLYADRIAQNNEAIASLLANEDEFSKNKIALALKTKQQQDKIDSDRNKAGMDALNALASFQTAKTKELQAIGKAAAITQATIQTYQGATGAFAALSGIPFVGPALAIAAAAAIVAAGLANVAKISGTPLATGIDSVPGTGTRDNFPAMLMPGERVVPTETNKDLTRYLAEQAGTKSLLSSINQKLSNLQSQVVVNVGGREIINEINNQLDGGRRISL